MSTSAVDVAPVDSNGTRTILANDINTLSTMLSQFLIIVQEYSPKILLIKQI